MISKTLTFLYNSSTLKRSYRVISNKKIYQKIRKAPTSIQLIGSFSSLALGALVAYGFSQPANYVSTNTRIQINQFGGKSYAQTVRARLLKTYGFLTLGLGMTASIAILASKKGFGFYVTQVNPFLLTSMVMIGTMSTMMFTTSIPYKNPRKLIWWSAFNSCVGLTLVPIGILGGTIVIQAAMITGCILGSLSIVAAASPGDTFLSLGPTVGCGLGVLIASSFGQIFFPNSSSLKNITLYGGKFQPKNLIYNL